MSPRWGFKTLDNLFYTDVAPLGFSGRIHGGFTEEFFMSGGTRVPGRSKFAFSVKTRNDKLNITQYRYLL